MFTLRSSPFGNKERTPSIGKPQDILGKRTSAVGSSESTHLPPAADPGPGNPGRLPGLQHISYKINSAIYSRNHIPPQKGKALVLSFAWAQFNPWVSHCLPPPTTNPEHQSTTPKPEPGKAPTKADAKKNNQAPVQLTDSTATQERAMTKKGEVRSTLFHERGLDSLLRAPPGNPRLMPPPASLEMQHRQTPPTKKPTRTAGSKRHCYESGLATPSHAEGRKQRRPIHQQTKLPSLKEPRTRSYTYADRRSTRFPSRNASGEAIGERNRAD
ncbi:unnamed protein product [Urochloa humidicola]